MTVFEFEWRDEYLIYPAMRGAVSVLARVTAGLFIVAALFWVAGLALLCLAPACGADAFIVVAGLNEFSVALAVPCLYLLSLWCHQVLLAGRGMAVTRWVLLFLLFFAFLYPVCSGYELLTGEVLLVNQFLLPPVLYTVLLGVFLFNRFRMVALPQHYRLLLLFFFITLIGQYIMQGSFLILLLFCFALPPLLLLARSAPQIVSLPPRDEAENPPCENNRAR